MILSALLRPPAWVWRLVDGPSQAVSARLIAANLVVVALTLVVGCPLGDVARQPITPFTPSRALFAPEVICTAVSFAQLWLSGWVLLEVYRLRRGQLLRRQKPPKAALLWLLMCAGFFYLAVDEVAFLHEGMGKLPFLLGLPRTPLTIRIDDLIPVAYALIGLAVLARYRAELAGFRHFWRWVAGGMALALVSAALDVATHRKDLCRWLIADPAVADFCWGKLNALEEGCKILAEAAFLGAFLSCREAVRRSEAEVRDPLPAAQQTRRAA